MFDSLGLFKFLKGALYLNAAFAIVLATDSLAILPDLPGASAASISVIVVSSLLFLVGQTPAFPWICRLPIMWRLFPDIDGKYEVAISSNWSIVSDRREGQTSTSGDAEFLRRVGKAKITSRLTRIDMRLEMDDGYLTSEMIVCSLRREAGERLPTLLYIFDGHVAVPKPTDSQRHLGAGRISIPLERRPTLLEGNYWTDRNWHQGLNTAGRIQLKRS